MKFSIRDLILVTVIVAMGLGWYVHRRAMNAEYRRMDAENEILRAELLELRFPKMEPGEQYEAVPIHTLEFLAPKEQ
jgi:hypothetical protein